MQRMLADPVLCLHRFSCYVDYCPDCTGEFVGYCDKTCEFCWCPPSA